MTKDDAMSGGGSAPIPTSQSSQGVPTSVKRGLMNVVLAEKLRTENVKMEAH